MSREIQKTGDNRPVLQWLEEDAPDFEEASLILSQMIQQDLTGIDEITLQQLTDLQTLAEYIIICASEPIQDPISMGWVGRDGLP